MPARAWVGATRIRGCKNEVWPIGTCGNLRIKLTIVLTLGT